LIQIERGTPPARPFIEEEIGMKMHWLTACGIAAAVLLAAAPACAQQERPLDEVKKEVLRRAGRSNPFDGIRGEDAEHS
jgi:hypothetical protein